MFPDFPKTRPVLPEQLQNIYYHHYKKNREGQTPASFLSQKMESWLHKQVAKDISCDSQQKSTLEIGAGTLNQLQYENNSGVYDIVEPFGELYARSKYILQIRNIYSDISEVPENIKYDRIISIATFEHICNLPEVVARCGLLLRDKGVLRVSIPSEGTFLWKLAWRLTTGLEFWFKYGLDYGVFMRYEHVNSAKEIEELLRFFFARVNCKVFGLSKNLSLYQYFECTFPSLSKCKEHINETIKTAG